MSFRIDDIAEPDSANVSFNLNDEIVSNHSHISNYSKRNYINNNIPQMNNMNYNQQIPQDSPMRSNNFQKSPSIMSNASSRPMNPIIVNSPIQLIDFSRGFQINKQALDFLKSIKEEIIIISVVGKARTGKSYLMNLLLDLIGKGNAGFQVASSLQSCTKGIWLWEHQKIL